MVRIAKSGNCAILLSQHRLCYNGILLKNFPILKGWNWNCCYWPDPAMLYDIEQYFNGTTYLNPSSLCVQMVFGKKRTKKSNCRGHDHFSFRVTHSPFDMKMPLNPVICINYRMNFVSKRFPFSPWGIPTNNDMTIRYRLFTLFKN